MRTTRAGVVAVGLLTTCLLGCQKPELKWKYTIADQNGSVVWDMTGLCLKFEGVRLRSGGGAGRMIISSADEGGGRLANAPGDPEESYDSETGINTIRFNRYVIEIRKAGKLVMVDDLEFVLKGKPKQTILFPKVGQPTMRDYLAGDSPGVPLGEMPQPIPEIYQPPPVGPLHSNAIPTSVPP